MPSSERSIRIRPFLGPISRVGAILSLILTLALSPGFQTRAGAVALAQEGPVTVCRAFVFVPDVSVTLVIPSTIPEPDYVRIETRVRQRVELLRLNACSVERHANTIMVRLAFESGYEIPIADLQVMLSRRGLIQIIDPAGAHVVEGSNISSGTGDPAASPVPVDPSFVVLATNDDITEAYVTAVMPPNWGVLVTIAEPALTPIGSFSEGHVGDEWIIVADEEVIVVSTIGEPFAPGVSLVISGLDHEKAASLAFYFASDEYPVALCVGDPSPPMEMKTVCRGQ